MDQSIPHDVQQAATWLTAQLFDEMALDNAATMQPHFTSWLLSFRLLRQGLYRDSSPTALFAFARRQARLYYDRVLRLPHHTPEEQVQFWFSLTWALLIAVGYFGPRKMPVRYEEDPQQYLTMEGYHFGHYATLIEQVRAMCNGMGKLAIDCPYDPPIVQLLEPFYSLN